MKKRLIILSDLWGREKSEWINQYTDLLNDAFETSFYDSCELGKIDKSVYEEKSLHGQFINNGIETAVNTLLDPEKGKVNILAFSIGGTIAWKFGIASNNIESLYCISSTRLRNENIKPNGNIELYYGEDDKFKPQLNWFEKMEVHYDIIKGHGHLLYTDNDFATMLCKRIIGYENI